jgi:signal transduction histidine kinase
MLDTIARIFSADGFMPHGHCYLWLPSLVGLHVGSDVLIGTAYVVIALTLWGLVRRIRLPFSPMILAFGTFIGACGLTHYMEVWTLWVPDYWLSGAVKLLTAVASVATGVYLVRLRPTVGRVAEGARLAEERRIELETKNHELERLYAQVKELDDARTRFFANASHELRTPLALVLGALERTLQGDCPPAAAHDLGVARRNARVLLRHVNDLLDVARLEEGRMAARYARVDLAGLVRDTAAQFEVAAVERRIALEVRAPDALAAEADAEEVQRVVVNLLGNAFQFVPDDGRVTVELEAEGGRARLEVSDSGPGIAEELRSAIFERFRQDDRLARRGGTGLGLSIAKDFVELHGGRIEATAGSDGGALFRVDLPLAAPPGVPVAEASVVPAWRDPAAVAEELRAAPGPAPEGGPGPEAPAALVAEDNPEMSRFVAEVLARDFRVATARDGEEALQKADALQPDLVVTDVMMPRLGGEGLVAALRERPALAQVPILVLTAREDDRLRVRLLAGGAQDFVVKPFPAEELRVRARNLAAVKRSRDVLEGELAIRGRDLEAAARELARRKRALELALDAAQVARDQAERASKVKSVFLGMASHELRTPLTAMLLAVEVLKAEREAPLAPRQRENVRRIDQAARRLLALVESLLEYTRVESGRLVVKPEPCDLAALAAEVVDEALPQAQRKLLALRVVAPPDLEPLETDPRLVRLVLVNLVVNAVKYTERGEITVAVGAEASGRSVEVRDTGPGIPPEEQRRIFEPFEQLGAGPTRGAQGVGLGLSLVKGVIEALGGKLSISSAPGRGSTFRVTLPERPPVAREEEAAARG